MATNDFHTWLGDFAQREQRRNERLVRAAYGVGHTHRWFRALDRAGQEAKVQEWVDEALDAAEERRARRTAEGCQS